MKRLLFFACIAISSIAYPMHLELAKAHWVIKVVLKKNTKKEYIIKEIEEIFSAKTEEIAFYRLMSKKMLIYLNADLRQEDIKERLEKKEWFKEKRLTMQEAMPLQNPYTR